MKKLNRSLEQSVHIFEDPEVYWATFDLGCSAALTSIDFEIISLDRTNPHKIKFIFLKKPGLESAINDYWGNNLKVDAQTYFNNIKRLKNQIYSA
jgi:hypothetical protein